MRRREVLAGLLAGIASPAWSKTRPMPRPGAALPEDASALVAAARLGGTVGFVLADAATGRILESADADQGLPPASTAKTVTTLYALDALGPGHRFATRLVATGPISGGRIAGDLVLAGGGDPTLATDDLAGMAADLAAAGVRGVTGRFLVWDGALPRIATLDPDQPVHVGYSPGLSGLNLNFNRVYFDWTRTKAGYAVRMDARSERIRPLVSVASMAVVDRAAPLFTWSDAGGSETWTVARAALGKAGGRWLPVRDPALYAGDVFRALAAAAGTALPAAVRSREPVAGAAVVTHESAPLTDVLRDMLKFSTNVTAEAVGLAASIARGGTPATLAQSAAQMNAWAEAALGAKIAMQDHSGLGDGSRIAPAEMARVLVAAASPGVLRGLFRVVALPDEKGRPLARQPAAIAAKTGTLNFVSGLTGYLTPNGGPDLVFAIYAADVPRHDAVPLAARERPDGLPGWLASARRLQQRLLGRWAVVYR